LDTRLVRWLSLDPELQPWQSPFCSMNNNPIAFNDVLGDDIIADRKEKKALKKRVDWKELKKEYHGKWFTDGKIFSRSNKNLNVHLVNNDSRVTNGILTAQEQSSTLRGGDSYTNEWHLYYNNVESDNQLFQYDNRDPGKLTNNSTSTLVRNYNINIGTDFTNRKGVSINQYLSDNRIGLQSQTISVQFLSVKPDDVNITNPATYFFFLNGTIWNMGLDGANGNMATARFGNKYKPLLGLNLATSDVITAWGIWNSVNNRVDECNGFIIRVNVTITKWQKL